MEFGTAQAPAQPPAPARSHEEYPLVMVHPNARKAEVKGMPGTEKRDSMGNIIEGQFWSYAADGDFMAPVTVYDPDHEAIHYAQGYRRGGFSDVTAFQNMTAGSVASPPVFDEWPKWMDGILYDTEAAYLAANPPPAPRHTPSPKPKTAKAQAIGKQRRKPAREPTEKQKAHYAKLKALAAERRAQV